MRLRGCDPTLTIAALARRRLRAPRAAEGRRGPRPARPGTSRTAEVVRTGGAGEVAVPGAVQARKRASLSARMPASVVELPYQEGQWVKAGAVVVRLDDAALRAAVAAAEAGVRAAEADLDRTKSLLEKGAATPRELEQMTAAASGAQAQLTGRQGRPVLRRPARAVRRPRRGAPGEPRRRREPRHAADRDRGRGRPRAEGDRRVLARGDAAARVEAQGAGRRPAVAAHGDGHRDRARRATRPRTASS